jgi:hypothetical protein
MNKTIKRIFAGTVLGALVTMSGLLTIILFPEPLFANKLEHGQFTVYSNDKIENDIGVVLDDALDMVKDSELYDPDYTYDVFLSYNSFFNKIDDTFIGFGPTARATDNNVIIKVDIDAKRDLLFVTFNQDCQASLTYIIAHEMVHCLQEHKYGKLKFNPFRHPVYWKLEGYPEYVSRRPMSLDGNYNLAAEIERYVVLESKLTDIWIHIEEGKCKVPKYYYKSRMMTEYLMDVKHWSYDKILNDTISEDRIYAEMIRWKDDNKIVAKIRNGSCANE